MSSRETVEYFVCLIRCMKGSSVSLDRSTVSLPYFTSHEGESSHGVGLLHLCLGIVTFPGVNVCSIINLLNYNKTINNLVLVAIIGACRNALQI